MSNTIFEIKNLYKNFGSVKALTDVNLSADYGRITVFLGENGAGKTTTLKCALGFLRPNDGRITINAKRIGYVPERPAVFPWLTGHEVLSITCRAFDIPLSEFASLVSAVAQRLGFEESLLSRRVQTYSNGNQKKFSY